MATINKKLVHFNKLSDFELRLEAGDILSHSIVFIKDANMIWTHGEYYSDTRDVLRIAEQELSESEQAQVKANLGIKKEVAIGEAVPLELPDLFIDTSRDYGDVQSDAVEEAPVDGEQYARQDAAWIKVKSSSPFANQEYADIVINSVNNGVISSDDYNKLSAWAVPVDEVYPYAETLFGGVVARMTIANTDDGIYAYIHMTQTSTNSPLTTIFSLIEIKEDLTLTIKEQSGIGLNSSGDGTRFLANDGSYKEIESGISDAPSDGNLYARKNKAWELLNNSDPNMFPLLEEIGIVLDNGSATEEQYNKILLFYNENKISNGNYEIAHASFWSLGEFYLAEIRKFDTFFSIDVSEVLTGSSQINASSFILSEDLSLSLDYSNGYYIESYDNGLSISAISSNSNFEFKDLFLQTSGDGTKFLADNGEYVEIKQGGSEESEENNVIPYIEGYSESNRLTVQVSSSDDYNADIVGGFITAIKSENLNLNFITTGFYRLPIELSRSVYGNYRADVLIKKLDPAPSSATSCMSSTVASCDLFGGYDVYISYFNGTIAKKVRRDSSLFSFEEINSDPFNKYGLEILTQNTFEGLQVYAETLISNHKDGYINLLYGTEVNKYTYRKEYTRDEYDISFDVIGSEIIIYNASRSNKICKIGENGVSEANLIAPVSNDTISFDMYMLCGYLYLKANTSGFTITNNKNVTKNVVLIIENDGTSEVSTSINGTQLTMGAGEKIVIEVTSTHKDIFISKKYAN